MQEAASFFALVVTAKNFLNEFHKKLMHRRQGQLLLQIELEELVLLVFVPFVKLKYINYVDPIEI